MIRDWLGGAAACLRVVCLGAAMSGALAGGVYAFDSIAPIVAHERAAPRAVLRVKPNPAQPKPAPILKVDLNGDGVYDIAAPSDGVVRGVDAYGAGNFHAMRDGGARMHEGVDYVAPAGSIIDAPIGGEVTKIGFAYDDDRRLKFVEITNSKLETRVFYVDADVTVGDDVVAGDPIGHAQDLSRRYPGGMTNHVHVELRDATGAHVDPSNILPGGGAFHGDGGHGSLDRAALEKTGLMSNG